MVDDDINVKNINKKNNDTYGSDGRKLYFVYFKEEMSDFDLYTFTNDNSDSVTIDDIAVESIHYYDKRYNGVVDLGIYPFSYPVIIINGMMKIFIQKIHVRYLIILIIGSGM